MAVPRRSGPCPDDSMPDIARIGRAVAERRIALRLTQQTVADLAGVSRSTVQSLERGTGSTSLAAVIEIATVLGMRLEFVGATQ